jgi:hypothetical protein
VFLGLFLGLGAALDFRPAVAFRPGFGLEAGLLRFLALAFGSRAAIQVPSQRNRTLRRPDDQPMTNES